MLWKNSGKTLQDESWRRKIIDFFLNRSMAGRIHPISERDTKNAGGYFPDMIKNDLIKTFYRKGIRISGIYIDLEPDRLKLKAYVEKL